MLAIAWNILLGRILGGAIAGLIFAVAILSFILGCIESRKAKKIITARQPEEWEEVEK